MNTDTPARRILLRESPLIIAHRGFSGCAPENTLPAFEAALSVQADIVELDARSSSDGELVVIHDHELDRTTDAKRKWRSRHNRVATRSAAELQTLDAGAWFDRKFAGTRLPSLLEAVSLIRTGSLPLIERKGGEVKAYLDFLRQTTLIPEVIVQSFDWEFLRQLHEAEPKLALGALGPAHLRVGGRRPLGISRKLNAAWLKQVERTGARIVVWNAQVSKGSVRLAHERGLKVWVYTVNNVRLARRLLDAGVDGLITNEPVLIANLIRRG